MKKFLKVFLFMLLFAVVVGCASDSTDGNGDVDGDSEQSTEDSGEQEVSGEITVLTNRTDIVDTRMVEYAEEFNEIYPDVEVNFEAMTDYEGQVQIRMNTEDYGDVLLIPNMITLEDLPNFFEPLGDEDELAEDYLFVDEFAYQGTSYGVPIMVSTFGAVYNEAVFEEAGVTELPATPEEFLEAMHLIKDNTDAIPYYTNYNDGWPLSDWENQRLALAGDGTYVSQQLPHMDDPFSEGRPHNTLYRLMYDLAEQDLIENDPITTDWEESKQMLADGEVASMFLGIWAVDQIQELSDNPEDIGYMPFPYTHEDGSRYAAMAGDYKLAINKHSDNKDAAFAWVDWFTNESGYAVENGTISPVVGDELPEILSDFEDAGVELIENLPALEGEEDLQNQIDSEGQIGLGAEDFKQRIIEAGIGNRDESFEDIMEDLNTRWAEARESLGVED